MALAQLDSLVGQVLMASQDLTEDPVRKDIQVFFVFKCNVITTLS